MSGPRSRIPTTDLRTVANRESRRPARAGDVTFAGQRSAASESSGPSRPRVNLSSHTGLLLAAGTGLIALRLFESGKLKRAWTAAISGPGTPPKRAVIAAPTDSGQAGTGTSDSSGSWNGPPGKGGSQFGLSGVTRSFQQTNPQYTGPDHGLVPDMVAEWNYLLAPGSHQNIMLPPGSGDWVETASGTQSGLPGYETWKQVGGKAVLSFLHLFGLGKDRPGSTEHGGATIGTSGWPTDPSGRFGPPGPTNAHLAVIANAQGRQYLG